MEEYISCAHRVENDSHVIKYVMDNLHLLENSKAVYKHGDFHLGNLRQHRINAKIRIIQRVPNKNCG